MSKASKWLEAREHLASIYPTLDLKSIAGSPARFRPASYYEVEAEGSVSKVGLETEGKIFTPTEALRLADWIYETFGEEK